MKFVYNLALTAYKLMIHLAAPFHGKASKMVEGRKKVWEQLLSGDFDGCVWFHTPSLGEFEQGRPVIEALKKKQPDTKVLLTFFSPSGYDVRKNYEHADLICYLPFDSARNARKFLAVAKPSKAVFVKYDIWYHYLNELNKHNVPSYLISAIFRPSQVFFKSYGKWYRKALDLYSQIFVQDAESLQLLTDFGITNTVEAGDTRFDRVVEIVKNAKPIPLIEKFKDGKKLIVIGSSWPKDEAILANYIHQNPDYKYIIAPHEVHESHINAIVNMLKLRIQRWSTLSESELPSSNILIIDTIGMLSSLYKYGEVAYIGGGFGVGIHNILEAATYGIPVIFGPNFKKFKEARDLTKQEGAFTIHDFISLQNKLNALLHNDEYLAKSGEVASTYVQDNKGATQMIIKKLL